MWTWKLLKLVHSFNFKNITETLIMKVEMKAIIVVARKMMRMKEAAKELNASNNEIISIVLNIIIN